MSWKEAGMQRNIVPGLLLAGILLAPAIGVRIEVLNQRAGNILPRRPHSDGSMSKWRVAGKPREFLRQDYEIAYREANGLEGYSIPLPPAAAEAIAQRVERDLPTSRYVTNSDLRDAVSSIGLLQYPLSLALIVVGTFAIPFQPGRVRLAICATAISTGAICLLIADMRNYFGSLG
ncbi:MAG: hypothetical protein AB7I37_02905 [Pirellulales bacterium]